MSPHLELNFRICGLVIIFSPIQPGNILVIELRNRLISFFNCHSDFAGSQLSFANGPSYCHFSPLWFWLSLTDGRSPTWYLQVVHSDLSISLSLLYAGMSMVNLTVFCHPWINLYVVKLLLLYPIAKLLLLYAVAIVPRVIGCKPIMILDRL